MRTRWIRFRVKYTWVLELWGPGSAGSRTLPELSAALAQAGRGVTGVSRDLSTSWSGHQLGLLWGPQLSSRSAQGLALQPRSATEPLGLGPSPRSGLGDKAHAWRADLLLASRPEEPAGEGQRSAEPAGVQRLVASLTWAPPSTSAAVCGPPAMAEQH